MKLYGFVTLMLVAGSSLAAAQSGYAPSSDVLGAHLNYGRGCTACHAPHSGANGNGNAKTPEPATSTSLLWGEDVSSLYGKTILSGGGKFVEVLPTSLSATTPDASGILTCLSCHDGNYATGSTMKNRVYETLPATYGTNNPIPTLIENSGTSAGSFMDEHPIGLSAQIKCGSGHWDCSQANGIISMKGANSSRFVSNYGFFVKPGAYNNSAVVVCTTCHNPHSMNVVTITSSSTSGLPAGNYPTMFFLRAPYNPDDTNPQSNQTAQFCRQCHGDLSNETNGGTAGTVF